MKNLHVCDMGSMAYGACWNLQQRLADSVAEGKAQDTLLLVQHPPVLTLGASFHEANLLLTREEYEGRGIAIERTDRGGDVTYHGPGQLVAYPIFDIARHGRDLHLWMRDLEQTVMDVLPAFGLEGRRFPPHTGVWVGDLKIAAIGVKVRRWVNLHGIALNCDNDLSPFETIVPCGIHGYGVTSLSVLCRRPIGVEEAAPRMIDAFEQVFGFSSVERLEAADLEPLVSHG